MDRHRTEHSSASGQLCYAERAGCGAQAQRTGVWGDVRVMSRPFRSTIDHGGGEAQRQFINQQDLGFMDQHHGQRQHLLLAT